MADAAPPDDVRFDLEVPSAPLLQWRPLLGFVPVLIGCLAATVLYWPAIDAPLVSDDYIYLRAAKTMAWGGYLHAAVVPHSNDATLSVTRDFWRPLYFLSYKALWPAFGGRVVAYHVLLLGIHFAGIVMVWLLARRLTRRVEAAGVAALVFAVHPAGFLAVAWISYLNSASVPLALGAFLAFVAAVETEAASARWRRLAAAVGLAALAVGFRETAIVIVPIIACWYLLCPARERLRAWRSYAPLVPFALLVVVFQLLRTRFLTEPTANPDFYNWGGHVPKNAWSLIKLGFGPFDGEVSGWRLLWAQAGGLCVFAGLLAALIARRWLLAALVTGFVLAVLPFAPVTFGLGPRYFYFGSVFFAIASGAAFVELMDVARRRAPGKVVAAEGAALVALAVVLCTAAGNGRTRAWVDGDPAAHQRWVDELRADVPALEAGATLYCVNTPLVLALFDAAVLEPTVGYYYPEVGRVVRIAQADVARTRLEMKPADRIFVYR